MNKYQEALTDIKCDSYNYIENNYEDGFKQCYKEQFAILQELIDQNKPLTLEQCIKEWEERGWKVEIGESTIQIHYMKFGRLSAIHIYKEKKKVRLLYENLHYEEFHLLSKTLKALEVRDVD